MANNVRGDDEHALFKIKLNTEKAVTERTEWQPRLNTIVSTANAHIILQKPLFHTDECSHSSRQVIMHASVLYLNRT